MKRPTLNMGKHGKFIHLNGGQQNFDSLDSYTWPGTVSTCDTFLERGIVQASAGNNLMLLTLSLVLLEVSSC
ncbi:hypothetical protein ATANTOWER_006148 [Ataeniobius toweri]|uniref:Uncharacterized protein n=1 Tax=Ataeniobius toweri TaxID=208326 RepID=A0ABU7BEJ2_9TELE|nr:hypothetical protein [Ataeniobius toweri]